MQPLQKRAYRTRGGIRPDHVGYGARAAQNPNVVHLPRLLRLGGQRRAEHGSQASDERAAVHPLGPPAGAMLAPDKSARKARSASRPCAPRLLGRTSMRSNPPDLSPRSAPPPAPNAPR